MDAGGDGPDGVKRAAGAAALAVTLTFAAAGPQAGAQIYTRKNERGVVEATNVPPTAATA